MATHCVSEASINELGHQLGHMQVICTSFHTENHIRTSSLNFYWPNAHIHLKAFFPGHPG